MIKSSILMRVKYWSMHGTSKLVGGWSGAETTNKSGYSAIFIGCSTTSSWPIPSHFQVKKSLAQLEERRKLDTKLFTHMQYVCSKFGFDEVTKCGVKLNWNKKLVWTNKSSVNMLKVVLYHCIQMHRMFLLGGCAIPNNFFCASQINFSLAHQTRGKFSTRCNGWFRYLSTKSRPQ